MEAKIYEQSAEIRCYRCGSAEIAVICHHCGRPMCTRHGPVRHPLSWFTENREFKKLSLGIWPLQKKEGAHCEYHVHSNLNYRRIMIVPGILIILIGLLLFLNQIVGLVNCLMRRPVDVTQGPPALSEVLRDPGIYDGLAFGQCYKPELITRSMDVTRNGLVTLFGIAVLVVGVWLNRESTTAEITGRQTEVPLGLVSEGIEAVERLNARMVLDDQGQVSTQVRGDVWGEIRPNFRFTPLDLQRLQEYRMKYGFDLSLSLPFQAGYLLLEGRPNLTFEKMGIEEVRHIKMPEPRYLPEWANMLWLEGQSGSCPYLTGGKGSADPSLPRAWRYHISLPHNVAGEEVPFSLSLDNQHEWGAIPLRVIPLLFEVGNIRSLRLQVQFNPRYFPLLPVTPEAGRQDLRVERGQVILLEQAQVWVDPHQLGRPRSSGVITEVEQEINGKMQSVFRIDWRGLWFPIDKDINLFRLPEIRFDQPIPEGAHLRGILRVRVPSLLSQIRTIQYFSALGYPINDKKRAGQPFPFEGATYVDLEFDLALARLPVSTVTTLAGGVIEHSGAPTPKRVRAIMDALNTDHSTKKPAQHIYVRRVVESTPQVSEQSGEAGRWHWDISGRRYHQTFPIDFHIVAYGQGDQKHGATHVDMSVQGQVFDRESLGFLEATRDELREIILHSLKVSTSEKREGDKP